MLQGFQPPAVHYTIHLLIHLRGLDSRMLSFLTLSLPCAHMCSTARTSSLGLCLDLPRVVLPLWMAIGMGIW